MKNISTNIVTLVNLCVLVAMLWKIGDMVDENAEGVVTTIKKNKKFKTKKSYCEIFLTKLIKIKN